MVYVTMANCLFVAHFMLSVSWRQIFSSNFEAFASKLLENIVEMFARYYMHIYKSSTTS